MAGLSCGSKCAKYTLFIFNLLFWLAGCALLAVSIWLLVDDDAYQYLKLLDIQGSSEALVRTSAIMLCAIGSLVFLTGFLGCCGAMKESSCMLVTYAIIVIVLLCAQITAGVLAVVYRDQITSRMMASMNETVSNRYGRPEYQAETDAWNVMQQEFRCCGVVAPYDEWRASYWYTHQNTTQQGGVSGNVPWSCCVTQNNQPVNYGQCSADAETSQQNTDYYYAEGCYSSLQDWIKTHSAILIGVAFGLAATQLIGIIMACCLASEVRNKGTYA